MQTGMEKAAAHTKDSFWLSWIRAIVFRVPVFTVLWWILTEGEAMLSVWTLVGTGLSVGVTLFMWPPDSWTWRLWPLIRFIPFFMWHSLLGGMDVAYRALCPWAHVRPRVVEFSFTLQKELARVFFLWTVSLLPGTAAIGFENGVARIHVLDVGLINMKKLQELENRIAGMFGQE
ncbi:MAG TPA: Na+/H+ antiporter subunit E [Desulfomicrobiaceae bacterium]|nr:Na+/H+ antiporter subunit E [Desulfomicrobiaceae bacterium]